MAGGRRTSPLVGLAATTSVAAAAAGLAALARTAMQGGAAFLRPARPGVVQRWGQQRRGAAQPTVPAAGVAKPSPGQEAPAGAAAAAGIAAAVLAAAATPHALRRLQPRTVPAGARQPGCQVVLAGPWPRAAAGAGRVALAAWPWEDDDPYSRCSAVKLQVGLQFSKSLLDTLNGLADTADTSSDEGLHQLLLDVILALRRAEASWRYGCCERLILDSEDGGREAGAALQRWGIEGQSKWGDGEEWEKMDKNMPSGKTEYLVITVLVSCYGTLCPEEKELKVRSISDVKKVLDSMSGVQVDELMQLDVQWIPEEDGDTLSAMEVTMKFPELAIL